MNSVQVFPYGDRIGSWVTVPTRVSDAVFHTAWVGVAWLQPTFLVGGGVPASMKAEVSRS